MRQALTRVERKKMRLSLKPPSAVARMAILSELNGRSSSKHKKTVHATTASVRFTYRNRQKEAK